MRGIGTDIVGVERIAGSLRRSAAFAEAVFSPEERRYCDAQARPAQHYAARFAAKEAFLKAIGRGIFDGVALPDIEVVGGAGGQPLLRLGPTAAVALGEVGGLRALVSLTHEGGLALAFVVIH